MSILEFAGALEIFDIKILSLAGVVCVLTGLAKLAIPEKWRKFVTVIPFALGIIVCGIFGFFFESVNPFTPHTVSIGIQTGVAATIYYVVYEQFFKANSVAQTALITGLLNSVIKKDAVSGAVKSVIAALKEGGENLPNKIYEILKAVKCDSATVEEIVLTVKNITGNIKAETE